MTDKYPHEQLMGFIKRHPISSSIILLVITYLLLIVNFVMNTNPEILEQTRQTQSLIPWFTVYLTAGAIFLSILLLENEMGRIDHVP